MKQSIISFSNQFRWLVVLLLVVFGGVSAVSAQSAPSGLFKLIIDSSEVTEGNAYYKKVIIRAVFTTPKGSQTFNGTYSTKDGTAAASSDYGAITGSISLKDPGANSQEIQISVYGDTEYEMNETFELIVTEDSGKIYSATITIKNDDAKSFVSVDDPQIHEGTGDSHTTQLVYRITRSGDLNHTFNIVVSTDGGTAAVNQDYIPLANHVVQFGPDAIEQLVMIQVARDAEVEPDETVLLNLTSSDPAAFVTKAQGIGTILDDDQPVVSINDAHLVEGSAGSSMMMFTLTLSHASYQSVQVNTQLSDITTYKGQDYRGADQTIIFPAGETTRILSVEILGDESFEPDETFVVNLEYSVTLAIGDDMAIGTILNDDAAPPPFVVTSFSLIDAKTDNVLIENFEGGTIDLTALGAKKLTIRANTNPATVGSVRFSLNDNPKFRKDNAAPYTLAKDVDGNLKPWKYALYTEYTLTATSFSEKKGKGSEGGAKTITFKITKLTPGSSSEVVPPTAQGERRLVVPPAP